MRLGSQAGEPDLRDPGPHRLRSVRVAAAQRAPERPGTEYPPPRRPGRHPAGSRRSCIGLLRRGSSRSRGTAVGRAGRSSSAWPGGPAVAAPRRRSAARARRHLPTRRSGRNDSTHHIRRTRNATSPSAFRGGKTLTGMTRAGTGSILSRRRVCALSPSNCAFTASSRDRASWPGKVRAAPGLGSSPSHR